MSEDYEFPARMETTPPAPVKRRRRRKAMPPRKRGLVKVPDHEERVVDSEAQPSLEELTRIAQIVFDTGALPPWFDRPERVLMTMLRGREIGLRPIESIQVLAENPQTPMPDTSAPPPAPPPVSRDLTHEIQVLHGGSMVPMHTAGLTADTMLAIKDRVTGTTALAEKNRETAKAFMDRLGLPMTLRYLTEDEGQDLLAALTPHPKDRIAPEKASGEWEKFIEERGLQNEDQSLREMAGNIIGKPFDQLTPFELLAAVNDLRKMADDKAAFLLMAERAKYDTNLP